MCVGDTIKINKFVATIVDYNMAYDEYTLSYGTRVCTVTSTQMLELGATVYLPSAATAQTSNHSFITYTPTAGITAPSSGNFSINGGPPIAAKAGDQLSFNVPSTHENVGWTEYAVTGGANGSKSSQLEPKCECGSAALGSNKHSDWCPLYKLQEGY